MTPEIRDAYNAGRQILQDAVKAGLMTETRQHCYDWHHEDCAKSEAACAAWNAHVAQRRIADKMLGDYMREQGRKYWQARDIAVGSKVYAVTRNMLNPMVATRVEGIAKVGVKGAYVASRAQRGTLDPDSFTV